MDADLRDLERRGDWVGLARGRLRAGLAVPALEAVRRGLAVAPADPALCAIRDEALAAFRRSGGWRVEREREGASGRVCFSPDGALIAVAAERGLVIYWTEGLELAGGGFAGEPDLRAAFAGRDLLVGSQGRLARWSFRDGRVKARLRVAGTILAVGATPSGSRATVLTEERLIRIDLASGTRLRVLEEQRHERRIRTAFVVAREDGDLVHRDELEDLAEGRHALAPDLLVRAIEVRGVEVRLRSMSGTGELTTRPPRGAAFSPCGSRLACCPSDGGATPRLVLLGATP